MVFYAHAITILSISLILPNNKIMCYQRGSMTSNTTVCGPVITSLETSW